MIDLCSFAFLISGLRPFDRIISTNSTRLTCVHFLKTTSNRQRWDSLRLPAAALVQERYRHHQRQVFRLEKLNTHQSAQQGQAL